VTIQKKSLISTLNTTKKAIVASNQAGTVSVEPATKNPARRALASHSLASHSLARRSPARRAPANKSFAKK